MQAKRILDFLKDIAANNNRPWFQEHSEEYLACKADFEKGIAQAIGRIASFDSEIVHLQVKDCVYRFYIVFIVTHVSRPTSHRTNAILVTTSAQRAKRLCAEATTSISNLATACLPQGAIGFRQISSRRAEMKSW